MDLSQFHFANPFWLWSGLVIPMVLFIYFIYYKTHSPVHSLEKFIDPHLLPYLVGKTSEKKNSIGKTLFLWSLVWFCLSLSLAGPRWNFQELETFSRDQSLVILLDLSESMNAADIKPSRLIRAKQKIEDLLNLSKGVKIGLIAFAADPHMIVPLTEDKETIRHLLTSLDTDLIHIQGSRLSAALDMASNLLEAEPGNNKAILVFSDGGFEDASAISKAKSLAGKGIVIHTLGIGTVDGAPLTNVKGKSIKTNDTPFLTKLEKDKLIEISKAGNGHYLETHYSDQNEALILKELETRAETQMNIGKKKQFWIEHFYLLIFPTLPIILWWFRRGYIFAAVLIFLTPAIRLEAGVFQEYFKNSEELGAKAMSENDYSTAASLFKDPYRKGVAHYKAGLFAEAETQFRLSSRPEVSSEAKYNLGNSLVQQEKYQEAISAYEEVLKRNPGHIKAKENLELVKKILEEQPQEPPSEQPDNKKNDKSPQGQGDGEEKENQKPDKSENKEEAPQKNEQPSQKDIESTSEDKQASRDSTQEEVESKDEKKEEPQKEARGKAVQKSPEDQDADLWLNQINNDPKNFLKNKFYIESKKNGTAEGIDPW